MRIGKVFLALLRNKKKRGAAVHPSKLIEGRGNGKKGKEGQKGGIY